MADAGPLDRLLNIEPLLVMTSQDLVQALRLAVIARGGQCHGDAAPLRQDGGTQRVKRAQARARAAHRIPVQRFQPGPVLQNDAVRGACDA